MRENQVRRRELIALLGGTVAAWPLGALAEQAALPVIGFLSSASVSGPVPTPFRKALNETGFFPDQNVTIEIHQAEGHYDRLPALAADFANRDVKVIVAAGGLVSARAAKKATSTIPILFIAGFDPVKLGIVSSYSRPDGNATGVSIYTSELLGKRLSLLLELMPRAERLALLINASNVVSEFEIKDMETVAAAAGVRLIVVDASANDGIESAFALAVGQNADALLVSADPFFSTRRRQIVALAAHYRLPAAYPWREYAEGGGLMSYGPILMDAYHQLGLYAGRILKGEKPSNLPVQLPRKFELVVNLRTAETLGLIVPRITMLRADRLID